MSSGCLGSYPGRRWRLWKARELPLHNPQRLRTCHHVLRVCACFVKRSIACLDRCFSVHALSAQCFSVCRSRQLLPEIATTVHTIVTLLAIMRRDIVTIMSRRIPIKAQLTTPHRLRAIVIVIIRVGMYGLSCPSLHYRTILSLACCIAKGTDVTSRHVLCVAPLL